MIEDEERPVSAGHAAEKPVKAVDASAGGERPEQAAASSPSPMSGADFQLYIGRGLRAVFDDVANQPIPDRFLELMKKLG